MAETAEKPPANTLQDLVLNEQVIGERGLPINELCVVDINGENIGPVWLGDLKAFHETHGEELAEAKVRQFGEDEWTSLVEHPYFTTPDLNLVEETPPSLEDEYVDDESEEINIGEFEEDTLPEVNLDNTGSFQLDETMGQDVQMDALDEDSTGSFSLDALEDAEEEESLEMSVELPTTEVSSEDETGTYQIDSLEDATQTFQMESVVEEDIEEEEEEEDTQDDVFAGEPSFETMVVPEGVDENPVEAKDTDTKSEFINDGPKTLPSESPSADIFEFSREEVLSQLNTPGHDALEKEAMVGLAFIGQLGKGGTSVDSDLKKEKEEEIPQHIVRHNRSNKWIIPAAMSFVLLLAVSSTYFLMDSGSNKQSVASKVDKRPVQKSTATTARKTPPKKATNRSPASSSRVTQKKYTPPPRRVAPKRRPSSSFRRSKTYKNRNKKKLNDAKLDRVDDYGNNDDYYYDDGRDPIEQDEVRSRLSKETVDPMDNPEDPYAVEEPYEDPYSEEFENQ